MTDKKLIAFAQGYLACKGCREYIPAVEDWVEWDKYDINFTGRDLWDDGTVGDCDLHISAYPRGWEGNLPEPLFSFIIKGEPQCHTPSTSTNA